MHRVSPWLAWFGFVGALCQGGLIMGAFTEGLHIGWLLALLLAFPCALVPVLGTAVAIIGGRKFGMDAQTIIMAVLPSAMVLPLLGLGWHIDRPR